MRHDKRQFVCRDEDKQAFAQDAHHGGIAVVEGACIRSGHFWASTRGTQRRPNLDSQRDCFWQCASFHPHTSYHSFWEWWTAEPETGTNPSVQKSRRLLLVVLSAPGQAINRLFSFAVSDLQASFFFSPVSDPLPSEDRLTIPPQPSPRFTSSLGLQFTCSTLPSSTYFLTAPLSTYPRAVPSSSHSQPRR